MYTSVNNEKIKYQQYKFTSPIEFAEAVKNAGFNFVTTANNHCLDNGKNGIKETIDALNEIRTCKYWYILRGGQNKHTRHQWN